MDVAKKLAELGIRKYTPPEIKQRYDEILEILKSPTKKHHEVIDPGIDLVTPNEWKKVPAGKAIACAFAGTNWVVAIVEKKAPGKIILNELLRKKMTPKTLTSQGLAQLMAQTIVEATFGKGINVSEIKAIGIALGFSQKNFRTKDGIDAQLASLSGSKGWYFTDSELAKSPSGYHPSLGKLLLSNLREMDPKWTVKYFAFRNDTHGVAEDGQTLNPLTLPIGFVFGTGDNGALKSINLRLHAISVKADPVMTTMAQLGFLPNLNFCQEYIMGGNYIKYRVISAIYLLNEMEQITHGKEIAKALIESENNGVISKIASDNAVDGIGSLDSTPALQLVCQTALAQAGQLMGINIAALSVTAGYKVENGEAVVPIEGSVFWKGFGVKEAAKDAVDQILPGNKLMPKEASGLRGVGKVALAQTVL